MFTHDGDSEKIRAATQAGVSAYVVDGMAAGRIGPIIDAAVARFEQFHALKREFNEIEEKLADRKVIERAKGILMKSRGLSEEDGLPRPAQTRDGNQCAPGRCCAPTDRGCRPARLIQADVRRACRAPPARVRKSRPNHTISMHENQIAALRQCAFARPLLKNSDVILFIYQIFVR